MTRVILFAILAFLLARLLRTFVRGVVRGMAAGPTAAPPSTSVKLARDPVCGTHVAPRTALSVTSGGTIYYFCSEECRLKFKSKV